MDLFLQELLLLSSDWTIRSKRSATKMSDFLLTSADLQASKSFHMDRTFHFFPED